MKAGAMLRRTAAVSFAATAFISQFYVGDAHAQYPTEYTLKIYNNSPKGGVTLFPVIATPTNGADQWLQAAFEVPDPGVSDRKYAHKFVYRTYVNYPTGIAPGGHVTITLPFWTQLVKPAEGTQPDQYIDWFNGGRVYLYDSPTSQPPVALKKDYERDEAKLIDPSGTARPMCGECSPQKLAIFKDAAALPDNDPDQLTEYTLNAIDSTKNPYKMSSTSAADYDISYVDHAYLPVAMGPSFPAGKTDIGYIGTILPVSDFRPVLEQFLSKYPGWPRYLDARRVDNGKPFLRLPGAYNAVKAIPDDPGSLIEPPGKALQDMKALWTSCQTKPGTEPLICDKVTELNGFFRANYKNYYELVNLGKCNPPYDVAPEPTLDNLLSKVYGWVQWNEHCNAGAKANDLSATPGYDGDRWKPVHANYIKLQYTSLKAATNPQTFNPYVNLIHGKNYLNMPGSYAFSIDDDVGNLFVANATGIIITVGGKEGLENTDPYDPGKALNVNLGDPVALGRPLWLEYGVCTSTADRQFKPGQLSFQIAVSATRYPCKIVLIDGKKRTYAFTIQHEPPYPSKPSHTPIKNCTAPPATVSWCPGVTAKTAQPAPGTTNPINVIEAPATVP